MAPAAPDFGPLRLASPRDISRIGVVATAGFRYSPVFDWERPYHESHPGDTILSYCQEFSSDMKNPARIVLVAIDKFDSKENSKTKAKIPSDNGWEAPAPSEPVIVGVASWKLNSRSPRQGSFQNDDAPYPDLPINPNRDKHSGHCALFGDRAEEAENKYFQNWLTMEMLVVHPAYWNRGHGTRLTQWGLDLAKVDNTRSGVIATQMGQTLYRGIGWKNLADVHIAGDEVVPGGVTVSAMMFKPKRQRMFLSLLLTLITAVQRLHKRWSKAKASQEKIYPYQGSELGLLQEK
ncbi:unnamed protein product [Clonostachys rosea]|uniref:N-acetyltransferase domain-containing protein n=1 Tax=Bionectria ochroleuca TaxID=29856 RepID=A0ABY6UHM1_BIOOC|nr:unnamed protein product [Clonostachys rosea]